MEFIHRFLIFGTQPILREGMGMNKLPFGLENLQEGMHEKMPPFV